MPKVPENLKKSLMIHVRVSPKEKQELVKKAKGFRSLTDYIRLKIVN